MEVFNTIDSVFYDVRAVRDAWAGLFSALTDERLSTQEGARIRQDKVTTLLQEMARHLGYARHFTRADFERIYHPPAVDKVYDSIRQIRQNPSVYGS
jgi:hypothetical protein